MTLCFKSFLQGVNPWIEVDGGVSPANAYKVAESEPYDLSIVNYGRFQVQFLMWTKKKKTFTWQKKKKRSLSSE